MEKLYSLLVLWLIVIGTSIAQLCRRDNSAVEAQERLCPAPCTRLQSCRSKDKQCVCDGPCGFVCIPGDLKCQVLIPPENGFVEINNQSFGGTAHYGCQEGFDLQGDSQRRCRGDGVWTDENPICILKPSCPSSNIVRSHGMLVQKGLEAKYYDGETVYFICGQGYSLIATRSYGELFCRNHTWVSNSTCEPKRCKLPELPDHAHWKNKVSALIKDSEQVHLSCADGYKLIGSEIITCDKGTWKYLRGASYCHNVNFEEEISSPLAADDETVSTETSAEVDVITNSPIDEFTDYWHDNENDLTSGNNVVTPNVENNDVLGCTAPQYQNVTVSFRESSLTASDRWFPDGTKLTFRCIDLSAFKFYGDSSQHCSDGHWTGIASECKELISTNGYSPPLVTYRSDGEIKITADGTIELPVGSTFHLNCYLMTANGDLVWVYPYDDSITEERWNEQRNTLTLIVKNMSEDDSGIYSCTSPIGRKQFVNLRVDDHFTLSHDIPWSVGADDSFACEFRRPANIIAWHSGVELKHFTVLPEHSVVKLACIRPFMYAFRGDKEITCHNSEWDSEEFHCERLLRNSEHLPPPINVIGDSLNYATTEDEMIVSRKGSTITLDCFWVYPEPGEGWYYPSWYHSSPHGDVELPAEIVRHNMDTVGGGHYSYRISVTVDEETKLPVTYTCMTPAGLQNQIRLLGSDYCLWESLTIPPVIEVNITSIKRVYLVGERVTLLGCMKGVLLGTTFYECLPNGRWSTLLHRCYF